MGRTTNDDRKSEPIKIRMSEELLERVERIQKETGWDYVARQDFLAKLVQLGLQRHIDRERAADEAEKGGVDDAQTGTE